MAESEGNNLDLSGDIVIALTDGAVTQDTICNQLLLKWLFVRNRHLLFSYYLHHHYFLWVVMEETEFNAKNRSSDEVNKNTGRKVSTWDAIETQKLNEELREAIKRITRNKKADNQKEHL